MSRYHTFSWQDFRITVHPCGWRKLPVIRRLPSLTGDRIQLKVSLKKQMAINRGHRLEELAFVVSGISGGADDSYHRVVQRSDIPAYRTKEQTIVDLGRLSFSGEYRVDAVSRLLTDDQWDETGRLSGVAVIQVTKDYMPIVFLLSGVLSLLAVGVTLVIQRWMGVIGDK